MFFNSYAVVICDLFVIASISCVELKIKFTKQEKGAWLEWGEWSTCSEKKYCLAGTRSRQRRCLKSSSMCTGIYMESDDCPNTSCKDAAEQILADVTEAATSSFISQECDSDVKYSVFGTHAYLLPGAIRKYFKAYSRKFELGSFNKKFLLGNSEIDLKNMTKYCFEPWYLTLKEAKEIFRFNRTVKSSLFSEDSLNPNAILAGLCITLSDPRSTLEGIYFALKSSNVGYKNVFYRRWRGQGFSESL